MQLSYNPSAIFSFVPVAATSDRLLCCCLCEAITCTVKNLPPLFNYSQSPVEQPALAPVTHSTSQLAPSQPLCSSTASWLLFFATLPLLSGSASGRCPHPWGASPAQPRTHHGGSAPVLCVVGAGCDEFIPLRGAKTRHGEGVSAVPTLWDQGAWKVAELCSCGQLVFPPAPGARRAPAKLAAPGEIPGAGAQGGGFLLPSLSERFCTAEGPKKSH